MIAQLSGVVVKKTLATLVVDVSGVGFLLNCPVATTEIARVGEKITLATSLIVREDSLTLYGFSDESDLAAFELLLTVSGIGAKIALASVNTLSAGQLAAAVQSENLTVLTKIPGVGKKAAQKIVLELKDKVAVLGAADGGNDAVGTPVETGFDWQSQVIAGLTGLGWSEREAQAGCENIKQLAESDPNISISKLMRAALASLARK